jgi:hypothetical protein
VITVAPGSHTHRLIQFLASSGEIPTSTLSLLGNERVLSALVHKLEDVQELRFGRFGQVYRVKLIQISGKKGGRSIRLYKKALPVLDELHPGLLGWYLSEFKAHSFSGDRSHIERNHRVAEAMAMCMTAGAETRPFVLPPLQKTEISRVVPDSPAFYVARGFKKTAADSANKTMYTRIVGALFCKDKVFAVYNTRDAVMKWSGRGEVKAANNLLELARMNAGLHEVSSAILFGSGADTALHTILESDKSRSSELRFDKVYQHIHFVPLDACGVRLLKILIAPNWNERLLSVLFEPTQRSYNRGSIEFDADVEHRKILSHLDGDIARLIRFRDALSMKTEPAVVLCYPWQTEFVKAYLGKLAEIRELEISAVEAALEEVQYIG